MSDKNNSSDGIGFAGILAIVFIVLKLCNIITWSWLWVLSPLWIGFVLAVLVFLIILIASVVRTLHRRKARRKR